MNDCYLYSVLNHTHLTYTPQQYQCMNDSYYYCTLNHTHLTYTPQQYQCVNDRYHYSLWTIRIWRTHHSNMNAWMTVTFIPFWIIRIWRTHHSNINAWMTVIIIPFSLCFFTNLRFTMYSLLWFRKRRVGFRGTFVYLDWYMGQSLACKDLPTSVLIPFPCGLVEYWYKGGLSLACNCLAPGAQFVSAI